MDPADPDRRAEGHPECQGDVEESEWDRRTVCPDTVVLDRREARQGSEDPPIVGAG